VKNFLIGSLQLIFGYRKYLFIFSCLKIFALRLDRRKRDYLAFSKMIPSGSNVLVIGANIGITTIPIAKRLTTGNVFAFEPVRQNAEVLHWVLRFFRQKEKVHVFNWALGQKNRKANMVVPVWGFTKKHGIARVADGIPNVKNGRVTTCEMHALDDVEELKEVKIDFIKIVAENYEFNIFSGGEKTIARNMPVIYCELWDNDHRPKVIRLISSYGYEVKAYRKGMLHEYNPSVDFGRNFLFLPG
jgi:FkbM family methyltransferase